MKVAQPIPYQGSKRNIARFILPFFPRQTDTLVEPFAGSAAMSLAAASYRKAARFHINDITYESIYLSEELIALLDLSPEELESMSILGKESQLELPIMGGWKMNREISCEGILICESRHI